MVRVLTSKKVAFKLILILLPQPPYVHLMSTYVMNEPRLFLAVLYVFCM